MSDQGVEASDEGVGLGGGQPGQGGGEQPGIKHSPIAAQCFLARRGQPDQGAAGSLSRSSRPSCTR